MVSEKTAKDLGFGSDKVFFIAEAGINHNGSMEKAKELIDLANVVPTVKFQKEPSRILTKKFRKPCHPEMLALNIR